MLRSLLVASVLVLLTSPAHAQTAPGSVLAGERDDAPPTPEPIGPDVVPRVMSFGMAIEFALGIGANNMTADGRLSLLYQFGTLNKRDDGRASGTYLGAGIEGTTGSLCVGEGDDYCGGGWRFRGTVGPSARLSWGRGKLSDSVFPLFSVYAKVTPFVSSHRGNTGGGGRIGIGLNGPGATRTLATEDHDSGSGQTDALGGLIGFLISPFTHLELFAEGERLAGESSMRYGFAFGFGI